MKLEIDLYFRLGIMRFTFFEILGNRILFHEENSFFTEFESP